MHLKRTIRVELLFQENTKRNAIMNLKKNIILNFRYAMYWWVAMSKRSEEQVDPEQQFILRLPDDIATKLDSELSTLTSSCSKLAISIDSDYRNCEVNYDGELIKAKLHDLPCVVESLKTTDGERCVKLVHFSNKTLFLFGGMGTLYAL